MSTMPLDPDDFSREVDEVYELLEKLKSGDKDEVKEATEKVDEYLREKQRKREEEELMEKGIIIAGCKTTASRTVINRKESESDKRKRISEELKQHGNVAFRDEEYSKADELYTSAILHYKENHILFTNRAQCRIRLEKFDEAIEDCKQAVKLNPDSIKAYITLARALRAKHEYQKALDVLEIAEGLSKDHTSVITQYRQETITEMKLQMLRQA